jgi:hypothetical protein
MAPFALCKIPQSCELQPTLPGRQLGPSRVDLGVTHAIEGTADDRCRSIRRLLQVMLLHHLISYLVRRWQPISHPALFPLLAVRLVPSKHTYVKMTGAEQMGSIKSHQFSRDSFWSKGVTYVPLPMSNRKLGVSSEGHTLPSGAALSSCK